MELVTRRLAEAASALLAGEELEDKPLSEVKAPGLTGRDIVSDQVIALADSYLSQANGWQGPAGEFHRAALDHIAAQAGQRFDPQLVEQFLALGPGIETQLVRLDTGGQ